VFPSTPEIGSCVHHWAHQTDLDKFNYPNQIGPGVYDIHSPNMPTQEHIVQPMRKAAERIPALTNIVAAAKTLRASAQCSQCRATGPGR